MSDFGYHVAGSRDRAYAGSSSIYEFIQRRSDWKKIEKTVDKVGHVVEPRKYWPDSRSGDVCSVGQGGLYCHVSIVRNKAVPRPAESGPGLAQRVS